MENLIGRKIKGFDFDSDVLGSLRYIPEMKKYVGKIGIIYRVYKDCVQVKFAITAFLAVTWVYPLDQIQPHLIPLEKQDEFFIGDKKMYSLEELENNRDILVELRSIEDWNYLMNFIENKTNFTGELRFYSLYHNSFMFPSSPNMIITVDQIKELNIISKNEENGKSRELSKSSSKDEPRSNRGRVIVRCGGQQVTNAIRLEGDKQSNNTSKTRIVKNENIKGVRLK